MYLRAAHVEKDVAVLQQLIRDNPLGILTTAIRSENAPFIQCSHIPFLLDTPDTNEGAHGILRGHMAKQNPQAKVLMECINHTTLDLPDEVLVLFTGPHHHYVTPQFYTATKPQTGKVVPTWNYAAVQVYGKIRVYCDSKADETGAFLQRQISDLSRYAESAIMAYSSPWGVADAPAPYIEMLKKNIIGIEIRIDRLEGKFKMSQELGKADRDGVVNGFMDLGTDLGLGMAKAVKERGDKKDSEG
ncbi:hypothetical protein PV04_04129 [Phialophora macrospora]|uniref:Transcriptional regulator n=1 Tax=Phialophora macrospora TaxID=1851006 RepID=A0A0D2E1G1_9EURO|nr:hypothetical protein PV04_04129 [Phialophora macrospora]